MRLQLLSGLSFFFVSKNIRNQQQCSMLTGGSINGPFIKNIRHQFRVLISTVGLRWTQNVFQLCDFMVSGASFKHKYHPEFFLAYQISGKDPKSSWKAWDSNPRPLRDPFQHSKNMIFKGHFYKKNLQDLVGSEYFQGQFRPKFDSAETLQMAKLC